MDKEKVLSFLNIDFSKGIDKFFMKLFSWFYVGFSIFVFGGGMLLHLISLSWYNILAVTVCIASIVILFVTIKLCKKHTSEWFHHLFASLCSVLVLLYGWGVFSKGELAEYGYPRFGWMHIAVLIASLILSVYMLLKFYKAYKITMNNTPEDALPILQSQYGMILPVTFAFSPMILVRLLKGSFATMGLGIGFWLWTLACIWIFMSILFIPRIVVILKYKVYLWQNTIE